MLFLSDADIRRAVTVPAVTNAVEEAFRLQEGKDILMPDRMHADYRGNTLLLMPCFTPDAFGTKLLTFAPRNAEKHLPILCGVMVLNDVVTGEALALMNGSPLTALRTAGATAVSIRYLAPPDVKAVGIVGAGFQGIHQALFAATETGARSVFVTDTDPARIAAFTQALGEWDPSLKVTAVRESAELLDRCQVVVTATTSADPVLPDRADAFTGKHIVAIGSFKPHVRELPEALFRRVKRVTIDTDHARQEAGDLVQPLRNGWLRPEQIARLGSLIMAPQRLPRPPDETTLFKSVGMALFDVVVGNLIYREAVRKKIGTDLRF